MNHIYGVNKYTYARYCTETDIFLKTTRAGSGSGFGGEISGSGWTCSLDMHQRHEARTCGRDMQHGHAVWTCSKDRWYGNENLHIKKYIYYPMIKGEGEN
jgi:hypothetical protein